MNDDFPGFIDDENKPDRARQDTDNAFPGFQEDDDAPAPAPDVGPAPSPAKIFDDDGSTDVPASAPAGGGPRPSAARIFDDTGGAGVDGPASSSAGEPASAADEDLKPGSRDDLWPCPHCGVRNKPERDTCRKCGKRPDEAKEPPLWLQPKFLGGTAAVLLVVVLAGYLLSRPDFTLSAPVPANIDAAARWDRSGGEVTGIGGGTFVPAGRFAVCGRVVSMRRGTDGAAQLCLITDATVSDERHLTDLADEGGDDVGIKSPYGFNRLPHARLRVVNPAELPADVRPPGILSLTGLYGESDGATSNPAGSSWVVLITACDYAAR